MTKAVSDLQRTARPYMSLKILACEASHQGTTLRLRSGQAFSRAECDSFIVILRGLQSPKDLLLSRAEKSISVATLAMTCSLP